MATVLPPPSKRQRTETAIKTREQQEVDRIPDNLGSVRVQFSDHATGQYAGAPISIPVVDATVKNLEILLNTLQGNVGVSLMMRGPLFTIGVAGYRLMNSRITPNGYLIGSVIVQTPTIPRA